MFGKGGSNTQFDSFMIKSKMVTFSEFVKYLCKQMFHYLWIPLGKNAQLYSSYTCAALFNDEIHNFLTIWLKK